jgi:hypothetical protein
MSKLNFSSVDQAFILGSSQFKNTQEEIASLTKMILESKPQPVQAPVQPAPTPAPPAQPTPAQPTPTDTLSDDTLIIKAMSNPKFDEIVKNYIIINHPEWLINNNNNGKSYFGNQYQSTFCSNIKNYIIFYIVCIMIFISLTVCFK